MSVVFKSFMVFFVFLLILGLLNPTIIMDLSLTLRIMMYILFTVSLELIFYHLKLTQKCYYLIGPLTSSPPFITDILHLLLLKILLDNVLFFAVNHQTHFKDSREESVVFTKIFTVSFALSSLTFRVFLWHCIPCVRKMSFNISFVASFLAMNSHSFPSSENVFISPFFPKGYFHWTQDSGLTDLFLQYLNNIVPFSSSFHGF